MTRSIFVPNMVQAITVLTVLKMLTNAQTTCNEGLGRVVYERLPDQQLQGFDDDVVRDTAPPFRVLEKCQELCLRDRTATNNLVRTCASFDFQPGSRIASFSGIVEYEESACYLTREQAHPEGIGVLALVPNSAHYSEVCLSSSRIERECPNRNYVFERHTRKKLKLAVADVKDQKEVIAANRTDCEDRCLNEYVFVCRSATYDVTAQTCLLSRFTRRSHPEIFEDDPNSDYLENTCLNVERRCDGPIIFVKEEDKRLGSPFEMDIFANISLIECQAQCLRAEKYFCRAVEYDEHIKRCIILEEDSMSQKGDIRVSSSPTHDLYDLVCLDNEKGQDMPDNAQTSHLFAEGRRPDTVFQRYRNSRLGGEFHSEITGRSLSECLDECLRQVSFQCRSAVFSERFRICRLSRFNQKDGHRVIYDADYDYYENLMNNPAGSAAASPPFVRPDPLGQDSTFHNQGRPLHASPPKPPGGAGFAGIYGGGNYPSYAGSGNLPHIQGYTPVVGSFGGPGSSNGGPPDEPGSGYWGLHNTHPTDAPSNSGYGFGGSITAASAGPHSYGTSLSSLAPSGPPAPIGVSPEYAGAGGSFPSPSAAIYYPGHGGLDQNIRCDVDSFRQVGVHMRIRRQFVRHFSALPTLSSCEKECVESRDFLCRSFNYRTAPYGTTRENCEMSDRDTRDLDTNNPNYFDNANDYDFYERATLGRNGQDCPLQVSQTCSEDGMEFTLRTPEGFLGRIYTHGYYDRCFYKGNGATANVLRISGAQGYPDCGTLKAGDMMTNIVVVQFSDYVQTSRDRRYNLTCLFRGPREAVVTSSYMTANQGAPTAIEYLPAENSINSRVRLAILYQGRPTNTIAVGDPLTFRLEAQDGYNYVTDIFATNVVARDPYSGRSVQLIDKFGCPVDNFVFPALGRSREGDGLEARFNAFKIPESNFLVFEATVRTCQNGCNPAYCIGQSGRSEQSLGRRRRREIESNDQIMEESDAAVATSNSGKNPRDEEHVREMIEIYESRYEMPELQTSEMVVQQTTCFTNRGYYGMIATLLIFITMLIIVAIYAGIYYKKYWVLISKHEMANVALGPGHAPNIFVERKYMRTHYAPSARSLFSFSNLNPSKHFARNEENPNQRLPKELQVSGITDMFGACRKGYEDPSEPIYTDPSPFERSPNLRSIAMYYRERYSEEEDIVKL